MNSMVMLNILISLLKNIDFSGMVVVSILIILLLCFFVIVLMIWFDRNNVRKKILNIVKNVDWCWLLMEVWVCMILVLMVVMFGSVLLVCCVVNVVCVSSVR